MLSIRNLIVFALAFGLQACSGHAQSTIKIGNTTLTVDTVVSGLDIPWEIIWGPDNFLWVTEREGIVSRINPATGAKSVILNISSPVYANSESGLLGMALHPDFSTTPEVFIVYTYGNSSNIQERLVKYKYAGGVLTDPDTLIDNIKGNTTHDGSRLLFLPDKTLLMTTGDAQDKTSPQNLSSLNGKVLRLNTDGSIPSDNPFPGTYVYTFGHRNAQGMMIAPDGKVYLSEHGPNTNDEFHLLVKGRNYGWPTVEGYCDLPAEVTFCNANNVVEPLMAWTPTIAPADLVHYSNSSFPEFDNCILLTILKDKKLIALKMNSGGTAVLSETHYLTNQFGRLRDICIGPDKSIYLATNGPDWNNSSPGTHSIIKLTVQGNTSVNQSSMFSGISIYPNPVSQLLNIDFNSMLPSALIEILDVNGKVCMQQHASGHHARLSLAELAGGMYVVRVVSEGKIVFLSRICH
jgi:glucose/arabinose dehydrogenase